VAELIEKIIRTIKSYEPGVKYYMFFCPGCRSAHQFKTPMWKFNGDIEKPTINPSILVHGNKDYKELSKGRYGLRCHSFVTDGKIRFLNDCDHHLRGQTVELEKF